MDLPPGPFDLIYADPPWQFGFWSVKPHETRKTPNKYPVMDRAALCSLPVRILAASDSVLLLWATAPNLLDAIAVMEAWGFAYKTVAFTWVKVNANRDPFLGMGYYTRQNAELCLLGTRGEPLPRRAHDVPSVILSRRREHSRKPDGAYDRIDRLFGTDLRRIELFARQAWPGWTAWGFDVPAAAPLGLPLEIA